MTWSSRIARAAAGAFLPRDERVRLRNLEFHDAGHGFDSLGMQPDTVRAIAGLSRFAYERYFRVTTHGPENIPRDGPAILAANHSGVLPIDGALIVLDVLRHTNPPRLARPVGDLFIPLLPIVGTFFTRAGMVTGSRGNFRHLLETGSLLLVFPEGAPGMGKGFRNRYRLQTWRVGHAEFAIRHRAPVIPVAVIGAEEAWPRAFRFERLHAFGAPFVPVPLTPFPLPVSIHVWYGEPISLHDRFTEEDADDPDALAIAAAKVRDAVHTLIDRGLRERGGQSS